MLKLLSLNSQAISTPNISSKFTVKQLSFYTVGLSLIVIKISKFKLERRNSD